MQSPTKLMEFFPLTPADSGLNLHMMRMSHWRRLFHKPAQLQGAVTRNWLGSQLKCMSPQRSEIINMWQLDGSQPSHVVQLCKDGFTWSVLPDS